MDMDGRSLQSKWVTPLSIKYFPWLEYSSELKVDVLQRFQELLGKLRWAVNIGRVEILLEL